MEMSQRGEETAKRPNEVTKDSYIVSLRREGYNKGYTKWREITARKVEDGEGESRTSCKMCNSQRRLPSAVGSVAAAG